MDEEKLNRIKHKILGTPEQTANHKANDTNKILAWIITAGKIVLSLVLFVLSIFMLIAFISYFFTWKFDQSFEWSQQLSNVRVENWAGMIGAVIANTFIKDGIGIASFLIPFMLIVSGLSLLKKIRISIGWTLMTSAIGMVLLPVILGFLFSNPIIFGVGLGGVYGYFISSWLKYALGGIITGILLLLVVTVASYYAWNTLRKQRKM